MAKFIGALLFFEWPDKRKRSEMFTWHDHKIRVFKQIKGRKKRERVQWLIAPKDSPTVRQGIPICSPPATIFLLPFCVSRSWHSYKAIFITWHDPANFLPVSNACRKPREATWETWLDPRNPPKFSTTKMRPFNNSGRIWWIRSKSVKIREERNTLGW